MTFKTGTDRESFRVAIPFIQTKSELINELVALLSTSAVVRNSDPVSVVFSSMDKSREQGEINEIVNWRGTRFRSHQGLGGNQVSSGGFGMISIGGGGGQLFNSLSTSKHENRLCRTSGDVTLIHWLCQNPLLLLPPLPCPSPLTPELLLNQSGPRRVQGILPIHLGT